MNTNRSFTISDNNKIDDINYQGFPLFNYGGRKNWYSFVTVEECQYLCEETDLCRYFNYGVIPGGQPEQKACYLKFGVGSEASAKGYAFGHKFSAGKKWNHICFLTHHFWLCQELNKCKCSSVCSMKVCLELSIFIFLSQVSLRSVPGQSQVRVRSVSVSVSV